jgi:hypothetical protein
VVNNEPDCARLLAQIEESLHAMKRHVITYQLQLLQLSLRKPVEITDTTGRDTPEAAPKSDPS